MVGLAPFCIFALLAASPAMAAVPKVGPVIIRSAPGGAGPTAAAANASLGLTGWVHPLGLIGVSPAPFTPSAPSLKTAPAEVPAAQVPLETLATIGALSPGRAAEMQAAAPMAEAAAGPVSEPTTIEALVSLRPKGSDQDAMPLRLSAFFDQSAPERDALTAPASEGEALPKARIILKRAQKAGVDKRALARAIKSARTQREAAGNLASLGLLGPDEYQPARDALDFKFVLLRLWHESYEGASARIDAASPVPALIARKDGVTYHIHGVAHGQFRPTARGRVLALVRSLEKAGLPLYSEQNFPKAYGYAYGKETLDHSSFDGAPARLAEASASAGSRAARLLRRAWELAVAPGSLLLPLAALAENPASGWAWVALAVVAAANFALLTSFLPIRRWCGRLYAWQAETEVQDEDMAHHYRAYADLGQRSGTTVEGALRVELPMPLKAEEGGPATLRSKAMAEAVQNAARAGFKDVHVLAGVNHAQELAWYLGGEDRPR